VTATDAPSEQANALSEYVNRSARRKTALVTGITGQDGSYLAELLLAKGYEVHGLIRRASTFNTERLDAIYQDPHDSDVRLRLHYGDLHDGVGLVNLMHAVAPDEVYHLGAQSHVKVSFEMPDYTGDVTGLGTIRLLEAIRASGISTRFYQASSSEMFGSTPPPQNEETVSSAVALRRRQGVRLLGDGQLP
jgi:GDPmannose 4,6-dehydratase